MAYTTVDNPELYFQTKLYTGNGGTQSITLDGSENMQPDWVWIKSRGDTSWHRSLDVVRGATIEMYQNETSAENTEANGLTSFESDGFSIGSNSGYNGNTVNFASWNWKAGGSASSNSNGSITSSVSANTTAGFSIVSYTGTGSNATVGHGLGVAPSFVIIKDRGNAVSWVVSGDNIGWNKNAYLDSTQAVQTANHFQDTAPTSSLMYLATDIAVNGSSRNYIMYCFAEKKGFSKFGSYTGNGSTDGTFVYTGFKPAFFMTKRSDVANSWVMFDNKRDPHNEINNNFYANTNEAEETGTLNNDLDFLSNGIKIREDNNALNASGGTYIYMAFAESPFVTSGGIPTTAR